MSTNQLCAECHAPFNEGSLFCPKCGARIASGTRLEKGQKSTIQSPKSGTITLVLCILLGTLGVHRFYVGKIGTGILNLLSAGGLGLWNIIDLILIIQNKFKDKQGLAVLLTQNLSVSKKMMIGFGVISSWLIINFALLTAAAAYLTNGLVTTANDQLAAFRAGNIEKGYSYTSAEYQKAIPLNEFKQWLEQFPELKNNKQVVFSARGLNSYEGFLNAGFLEGTLTAKDGHEVKVSYLFIKENGEWKVLAISTKL
jgi:TM2 domain-containing membrane protein YozV